MTKIRPHITEKSIKLAESGVFTLIVDFDATTGQVMQSVIEIFGHKPTKINLITKKYRASKRLRKPFLDRGVKKALVKLEKGQKIPGFELATEPKEDKGKTKAEKTKVANQAKGTK